jgi:hypothetical protein
VEKKMNIRTLTILSTALLASSCTSTKGLGTFTMASTHNVRGVEYSIDKNTKVFTEGESCDRSFFGLGLGKSENKLQIAMNDAIRNGQKNGVDGDLLVNVNIKEEKFGILGYSSDCIIIEGDLIRVTNESQTTK